MNSTILGKTCFYSRNAISSEVFADTKCRKDQILFDVISDTSLAIRKIKTFFISNIIKNNLHEPRQAKRILNTYANNKERLRPACATTHSDHRFGCSHTASTDPMNSTI